LERELAQAKELIAIQHQLVTKLREEAHANDKRRNWGFYPN
jgi:hypothetical protein